MSCLLLCKDLFYHLKQLYKCGYSGNWCLVEINYLLDVILPYLESAVDTPISNSSCYVPARSTSDSTGEGDGDVDINELLNDVSLNCCEGSRSVTIILYYMKVYLYSVFQLLCYIV